MHGGGAAVSLSHAAAAGAGGGCGREACRLASSLIVGGVVSDKCVPDEHEVTGGLRLRLPLGVADPIQHADKRQVQVPGVPRRVELRLERRHQAVQTPDNRDVGRGARADGDLVLTATNGLQGAQCTPGTSKMTPPNPHIGDPSWWLERRQELADCGGP